MTKQTTDWRKLWEKIEPAASVAAHLALLMMFLLLTCTVLVAVAPASKQEGYCTANAPCASANAQWLAAGSQQGMEWNDYAAR